MALIDRVGRRAVATIERSDPVTLEEFGAILARGGVGGKTKSGVSVGPDGALAIPAWYSGCRAISEAVEFLPTSTYRQRLGGVKELRADPAWLRRPDVDTPWSALVELWIMSLLHRGNAYAFKIRNAAGQVTGLRPLLPARVRVVDIVAGAKVFEVDGRKDIRYTTREILHIRGLSLDGITGVDPITYHAETLGRVKGADDYASLYLGEGVHKTTYLSVPQDLNDTQAKAFAARAKELWAGLQNAHQLGVIGNGAELKSLALNPEQLQLLESRRYGVIEIAMILRMPPHKLYELTRATFSNIEHQSIEWISDSVRPWVERIETWVNNDPDLLPPSNFIESDMEGLKRGDLASEMQAWSTGIQAGAVMPAEPRAKLGLPYLPGTRVFYRPLNVQVIDADTGQVVSDGSATPADRGGQQP